MNERELENKLIFFQSAPKSLQWAETIVTTRELLDQLLKEERAKGRAVYLDYESICTRIRCDKFKERCVSCIKSFWLEEHSGLNPKGEEGGK